ncbi:MAG: DNA repair protein RecN [Idiomarina sp.]|nr:DNA repair protein RecN [Idiomarina sp.]
MLVQMQVRHFAIVKDLHIEFTRGMTAITGETGAGKSIALDALSLCLGARADASSVRPGADKAEISAVFELASNPAAQAWLSQHELDIDDNQECILRRTLTKEGRSKAYINGSPAPLTLMKSLGGLLINIHGQHEHQQLSNSEHQRQLLDQYASHAHLTESVAEKWREWRRIKRRKQELTQQADELQARQQLISYQAKELQEFNLQPGEFETIEEDHQRQANASSLKDEAAFGINCLYDGEHNNAYSLIQAVIERLSQQVSVDSRLQPTIDMLAEASVQVEEAVRELRHYHADMDIDAEALKYLESRMTEALQLAKKHQIPAEQIPELQASLESELASIESCTEEVAQLDQQLNESWQAYQKAATLLSNSRAKAARALSKAISSSMQQLNMTAARFEASMASDDSHASVDGSDQVQFVVSTNPGQPLQSLQKVASGGELSRISLAIQVITANRANTPTLMFDEVDVGVSGPTAATVGRLLRELGERTQVICVTHLPQVAAKAHQQMRVEKIHSKDSTHTKMTMVHGDDRVIELARLLGGDEISDKALANAQDLLAS